MSPMERTHNWVEPEIRAIQKILWCLKTPSSWLINWFTNNLHWIYLTRNFRESNADIRNFWSDRRFLAISLVIIFQMTQMASHCQDLLHTNFYYYVSINILTTDTELRNNFLIKVFVYLLLFWVGHWPMKHSTLPARAQASTGKWLAGCKATKRKK